ncbi:MAG TPA: hypothetical protein VJ860_11840 [Polyangia bacterium]|jgi:hypothetical protein|nr:hypothetical protein [Polyangia bacterium]
MKRTTLFLGAGALFLAAACTEQTPPRKAEPTPAPAKPAQLARAADAGPVTDARPADAHLGMMERHAIWKAKKEADAKLATQLAAEEQARLLKFDKSKMPKHLALFAFEKKTRKALDDAAEKLQGKPDARDQLAKLVASQRKAIEAQAKILRAMDPQGGNSNIATDHDVSLNSLANDYPEAIVASFQGDAKPLADARAELDKREKKITSWLAELKGAKK